MFCLKKVVLFVTLSILILQGCDANQIAIKEELDIGQNETINNILENNNNVEAQSTNNRNIQAGMGGMDKSNDQVLQKLIETEVPKFKTFSYKDENSGVEIIYNLFIPNNYDKNKKYPLVQFIPDASLFGKPAKESLTQGYGALVWTTDEAQEKNECFVYVPVFNQGLKNDYPELNVRMQSIVDDDFHLSEDAYVNIDCLKKIISEYSIDENRIYTTGQSMGGMTSFYYACFFNDIFAAYMLVGSQFDINLISKLDDRNIIYLVSEGDTKASVGMNDLKTALDDRNIEYSYRYFSIKEDMSIQNEIINDALKENNNYNLFMFKKGEVIPDGVVANNEHMYSFDYAYKIDAAREYLFTKSKKLLNKADNKSIENAVSVLNESKDSSDLQTTFNDLINASLNQNMKAPRYVGKMYEDGIYVDKDDIKAYMYYKIGSTRGDLTSNYYLGLMYLNGIGVNKNDERAKKYLKIVADSDNLTATGVKEAKELYDELMNSNDISVVSDKNSRVESIFYDSKIVGKTQRMQVYLPNGYDDSSINYPVLYLINGGGTDDTAWLNGGNAKEILDNLIENQIAKPMIVVMPDGGMNDPVKENKNDDKSFKDGKNENGNGRDFKMFDSEDSEVRDVDEEKAKASNEKRELFINELVNDIIPYIDSKYKTLTNADNRAIAGFSYGGAEALYAGVEWKELFSYIGVFSMGIQGGSNASARSIEGSGSSLTPEEFVKLNQDFFINADETNDVIHLFYIAVGKDDQIIGNGAEQLSNTLKEYSIKHIFKLTNGGHNMSNWQNYLKEYVARIFNINPYLNTIVDVETIN